MMILQESGYRHWAGYAGDRLADQGPWFVPLSLAISLPGILARFFPTTVGQALEALEAALVERLLWISLVAMCASLGLVATLVMFYAAEQWYSGDSRRATGPAGGLFFVFPLLCWLYSVVFTGQLWPNDLHWFVPVVIVWSVALVWLTVFAAEAAVRCLWPRRQN